MLTLDFETFWSDTFSLSKMTTESYIRSPEFEIIGVCVKVDDGPVEWITGTHEEIRTELLKYPLHSVLCHNTAFDGAILSWVLDIHPKVLFDTLSMSRPIIGARFGGTTGGSLRALSEYYGIGHKGTEVYNTKGKHRKDFSAEDMQRFAEYCKTDVELTYKLWLKMSPGFPVMELALINTTLKMFTEPAIVLDKPLLQKHLAEVQDHKAKLLERVGAESRDSFMSNDKFAELLKARGVTPPTKISPVTGKEAYAFAKTDAGFQALLSHPDEAVQALAAARLGLKTTIEETRTQSFIDVASRGTLPAMLNYYGALNTARFSAAGGLNVQNLPRGGVLRHSMRAPDGYLLVACDSSQVEARTLAWFAGQDDLTEGFKNNEDIYSKFASEIYQREITKHANPEERHVGKTCILGLGYGVGAAKLQYTLANGFIKVNLPLEECQRIVKLYRSLYSRIPALWRECETAINRMYDGYNYTLGVGTELNVFGATEHTPANILMPSKLRLWYYDLKRDGTSKFGTPEYSYQKRKSIRAKIYGGALTENIVQSLARIIVSYQMVAIAHWLNKRCEQADDGKIRRIVNMVHDEVVVIVPEEEAKVTLAYMEKTMKTPLNWCKGLPVSCEGDIGKTYGDAK